VSDAWSEADERHMRLALRLAERGRGSTRPNPVVGAVLVKNGKVLASGFHRRAGLPHAEIEALAKLGMRAPGATLYVTLEPCCHHGRTGPCTESILRAGIRRVVVGCCDENPLVSGRGIAILRGSGVRVDAGCLKSECWQANRAFFTWAKNRRPWITLKVAATLDGCIGDRREKQRKGPARWITGEDARQVAHELRAEHDAVLVGVGTVLADNPKLTVRLAKRSPSPRCPVRVVLDSNLRTPTNAALFAPSNAGAPILVAASPSASDRAFLVRQRKLEAAGADVLLVKRDRDGHVALAPMLRQLAERDVQSLLVEGGSQTHGAFIREGLVDSVAVFLAPRLVGSGVPIVEGRGLDWQCPAKLGPLSIRRLGDDILLTADVVTQGQRRHS
jgi:diaminohydroxyphosphoribosylaminopyrimidine deaminase / 5-amino-6-(5-phosphoribosylamino)uracil reductase